MNFPKDIENIIYGYYDTNVHYEKYKHVLDEIKGPIDLQYARNENGEVIDIDMIDDYIRKSSLFFCYTDMMLSYEHEDTWNWVFKKMIENENEKLDNENKIIRALAYNYFPLMIISPMSR